MIETVSTFLVNFVHQFGYFGIFIMTAMESTFVPVPSEATMVPAGYLVQQGMMNLWAVLFCSITGTIAGSLFNYWIAAHFGRWVFLRYGKYMFFPPERMEQLNGYFKSHGEISIFTARLIPGVRHVISFPAGLAHMNLKRFTIYTAAGGSIWMCVLTAVGYFIGDNKELVHHYVPLITYAVVAAVCLMIAVYVVKHRRKRVIG